MSVSTLARASKIDSEASSIETDVRRATTTLEALFLRATDFTAFMNANLTSEFSQSDRDKYTDKFVVAMTNLNVVLSILAPLQELETEVITVEQFLGSHTGQSPEQYSKRFD
jgi:hypothetical protein